VGDINCPLFYAYFSREYLVDQVSFGPMYFCLSSITLVLWVVFNVEIILTPK